MAHTKVDRVIQVRNPNRRRISAPIRVPRVQQIVSPALLQRRRIAGRNNRFNQARARAINFTVAAIATPPPPPLTTTEMILQAIRTLDNSNGSSHRAISKFIGENFGVLVTPEFRRELSVQLRALVTSGGLVMVRRSYKIV